MYVFIVTMVYNNVLLFSELFVILFQNIRCYYCISTGCFIRCLKAPWFLISPENYYYINMITIFN